MHLKDRAISFLLFELMAHISLNVRGERSWLLKKKLIIRMSIRLSNLETCRHEIYKQAEAVHDNSSLSLPSPTLLC